MSSDALTLTAWGVPDNRRFYLVDERGWLVNGKHVGELSTVVGAYDDEWRTLRLDFPDGSVAEDTVAYGEAIDTRFFSLAVRARPLAGPWSDALSAWFGRTIRVVEGVDRTAVDRGFRGTVSLISRASLDGLARFAGETSVDARRFRMLVEIDGVAEHAEDGWLGVPVRVGDALVRFRGHVGRCSITTRHPESGVVDLPTLDLLRCYRDGVDATEALPFGIYGEVLQGGRVAVGDTLALA